MKKIKETQWESDMRNLAHLGVEYLECEYKPFSDEPSKIEMIDFYNLVTHKSFADFLKWLTESKMRYNVKLVIRGGSQ